MKKDSIFIIIILAGILIPGILAIPSTLNLHGKLTNNSGSVLSGNYNMTFNIYDVSTGGSSLWNVTNQTISVDSDGIYHFILTEVNLTFAEQYYLGITVASDSEMAPRINLTSTPYSFRTNVTDNLDSENNYEMQNLTLGEKITFAFGEIIDNIVDGWIAITGNLNVTGESYFTNASFNGGWLNDGVSIIDGDIYAQVGYFYNITSLNVTKQNLEIIENLDVLKNLTVDTNTLFVDSDNNRVGIGTISPGEELDVNGSIETNNLYENQPFSYAGKKIVIISPYVTKTNEYKGQLHTHSTNSDGADTPSALATAYKDAGYDFLAITDHDVLTPNPGVSGILHINGVEETATEGHIGNIGGTTQQSDTDDQDIIDDIIADSAIPIINHPTAWADPSIDAIDGYLITELYNEYVGNSEGKFDRVLTKNVKTFGIAADDCHDIAGVRFNKTWVKVFANNLSLNNITDALKRGNFYSSTGPELTISVSGNIISATTDSSSTIQFITNNGLVSQSTASVTSASYDVVGDEVYVRIKIIRDSDSKNAWSNPIYIYQTSTSELKKGGVIRGNLYLNSNLTIDINTLFVDSGNDRVGIGTASPSSKLDVAGNFEVDGTDFFVNATSGNVGIGMTTSKANLQFGAGVPVISTISNALFQGYNAYYNGSWKRITADNDVVISSWDSLGDYAVWRQTDANSAADSAITLSEIFRIENSGNVGIGTANPTHKLNVVGHTNLSGTLYAGNSTLFVNTSSVGIGTTTPKDLLHLYQGVLRLEAPANVGWPAIKFYENATYVFEIEYNGGGGGSTGNLLEFNSVWASDILVLRGDGNVGIGTTSPNYKLEVANSATALNVSGMLYVNSTNVGIGTDSPDRMLHIKQSADDFTGGLALERATGSTNEWGIATGGNDHLYFGYNGVASGILFTSTGGITATTLTTTGSVGIGVATSGVKLQTQSATLAADSPGTEEQFKITRPLNSGKSWPQAASFALGTYSTNGPGNYYGPDTRLDIKLKSTNISDFTTDVTVMTLQGNGNIGIGTSFPTEKLMVNGSLRVQNTSGTLALYVNESTGYVGIGTTTPQQELNVVGDLNITGTIINDAIYAQLSDLNDQSFASANVKQPINLTTTDEINGLSVSQYNVTISTAGVYSIFAQPQVTAGPGDAGFFHMWLEKHDTSNWVNVSNSNVELSLASSDEDVIPLIVTLKLNANEKIRVMGSVSDIGISLDAKAPSTEPVIPSIIFTMYRIGS